MGYMQFSPKHRLVAGLALVTAMALSAGGCSSFSRALGIEKVSPDEFAIVTKAPLVIPPDYTLRPPQPGAVRNQLEDPQVLARNAIFGPDADPVGDGVVTAGEFALLNNTGAEDADPQIRTVLTSEATALTQKDRGFTDRILFWDRNQPSGYDATVVDAAAESERIRSNEASGRPVTTGETPTITKDRGIF
jgi:hypothetical protein